MSVIDPWYIDHLACPVDGSRLRQESNYLVSDAGRRYPIVEGVPVLLLDDPDQTLWVADASLRYARQWAEGGRREDPLFVDTIGVSPDEVDQVKELIRQGGGRVDPVVSILVGATNGIAYKHLIGRLGEYPIPSLRLPPGNGKTLLDIGCNWGRWCLAAARLGYQSVGIDPSLGAVQAARRVAAQLGVKAHFVVGDARHLPFKAATFDVGFSYSVLQHFSREDAAAAVGELGRVLTRGGASMVQMPTVFGARCLYHQARRHFREAAEFDVRYYTVPALRRMFQSGVGTTTVSVDCFFGIGLQPADIKHMSPLGKAAIVASEIMRKVAGVIFPLTYLADSVYLTSRKSSQ